MQTDESPGGQGQGSREVRDTDEVTTPTQGLSPDHKDFLTGQAVKIEVAEALGVRSLLSRADNPQDGSIWENFANHPAILFPWTSPTGEMEYQVRPDDPTEDHRGRKRKYMWRKDARITMWALRPVTRADQTILLVEGTKQGLAAASYAPDDVAVYAIGGCRMWQKEGRPIPDLQVVDGHPVVVCLDSDTATNLDVYRSGEDLDAALVQEGATSVLFTRLKGAEKDGLDDILAARPDEKRAAFLARAIEGAKKNPADKRPKAQAGAPGGGVEVLPAPTNPLAVARVIEPEFRSGEAYTVRNWRGGWWLWQTSYWREAEKLGFLKDLWKRTEHAKYEVETKDGTRYEDWSPTDPKISNLATALSTLVFMDKDTRVPAWLVGDRGDLGTLVSCQNGLLRLDNRELIEHSAAYFNLVAVPFDYDADAPEPVEWLKFLEVLWPEGGGGQVQALQEWFGYVISGRTDYQKMFAVTGPPRSGKGTIAAVLSEMVGRINIAGPTLASFSQNFGMEALLGKTLALIADARISRTTDVSTIVERLLNISGEDSISVDRKYASKWEGQIPARIMLLSNDIPRFSDNSGAIATRWIMTETTESFLGREDLGLKARLMAELPGILNWALDGLERLLAQGRFTETEVGRETVELMMETASPYTAFVKEMCLVGPEYEVFVDDAWFAWEKWCMDQGRENHGTKPWMGRDLKSVVPGLKRSKLKGTDGERHPAWRGLGLKDAYPAAIEESGPGKPDGGPGKMSDGAGQGRASSEAKAQVKDLGPGKAGHSQNLTCVKNKGQGEEGKEVGSTGSRNNAQMPGLTRPSTPDTPSEQAKGQGRVKENARPSDAVYPAPGPAVPESEPVRSFCDWGNWEHTGPDQPCDLCDD